MLVRPFTISKKLQQISSCNSWFWGIPIAPLCALIVWLRLFFAGLFAYFTSYHCLIISGTGKTSSARVIAKQAVTHTPILLEILESNFVQKKLKYVFWSFSADHFTYSREFHYYMCHWRSSCQNIMVKVSACWDLFSHLPTIFLMEVLFS